MLELHGDAREKRVFLLIVVTNVFVIDALFAEDSSSSMKKEAIKLYRYHEIMKSYNCL